LQKWTQEESQDTPMTQFATKRPQGSRPILWAMGPVQDDQRATAFLNDRGWAVRRVYRGRDIVPAMMESRFDLVVIDIDLPEGDGLWSLDHLNIAGFTGPVVIFDRASQPRQPMRIAEIRKRAFFIHAPITARRLDSVFRALLDDIPKTFHSTTKESTPMSTLPEILAGSLQAPPPAEAKYGWFIGTSPVMLGLYEQIQNAARSHAPVFITGESGTGKDLCARSIHAHSPRKDRAYIPINCAAIPRDLLESEIFGHVRGAFTGAVADRAGAAKLADGGTLFLDEIGEMDPQMQTKLLRFLQDGTYLPVGGSKFEKVDVRIVCATNRDPFSDIQSGRLREDLFYRLHVLPIIMPPLRARGDDVIDIAQTLLLQYATEENKAFQSFTPAAEMILRRYDWPGNIRQLQNTIRQIVVMHDGAAVTPEMIPRDLNAATATLSALGGQASAVPLADTARPRLGHLDGSLEHGRLIPPLHITERQAIEHAITLCAGNIPRAAALLEISPSTIYRKKSQWDRPERL
jgi:two-component system repressor protein LuxO